MSQNDSPEPSVSLTQAARGTGVEAPAVVESDEVAAVVTPAAIAGRTPWELARMRLKRDKPTMVMLGLVAFAVLLGFVAPILSKIGILDPTTPHYDLLDQAAGGMPLGDWGGMSWAHPLGVEPTTGRDVLSRLVLGVTFSLLISLSATLVAVLLGTILGIIAGFRGGWVDFWISRLIDLTLTFPQTLMLLALSGVFVALIERVVPAGNPAMATYIVLVLGLFGWPGFARIIRGQVLSLREREFVESSKSLGASNRRIYFRELLPNLWAPILVYFTLLMPSFISAEAALSFLGVGIRPPTPTLGNLLSFALNYASTNFTFFFFPALIIATLVLSFNLLGDGLRDALDPKAGR